MNPDPENLGNWLIAAFFAASILALAVAAYWRFYDRLEPRSHPPADQKYAWRKDLESLTSTHNREFGAVWKRLDRLETEAKIDRKGIYESLRALEQNSASSATEQANIRLWLDRVEKKLDRQIEKSGDTATSKTKR